MPTPPDWFCPRCGWHNEGYSKECVQCLTPHPYLRPPPQPQVVYVTNQITAPLKSRGGYVVLGLLLGGLGIHNFYAGHNWRGVAQLILFVLTFWTCIMIPVIWMWVIIELFATDTDGWGRKMV
jgi:TM2 domain-containing membrane protein YozV